MARRPILIVEDDEDLVSCLSALLEEEGHPVITARTGDDSLAACDQDPALVLIDLHIPGVLTGEALVEALRARLDPSVRMLLLSGEHDLARRAARLHVDGYLAKPFAADELLRAVEEHARH